MRFYIFSPYFQTGGPEALHQLCSALNDLGQRACMWYVDEEGNHLYGLPIIPTYAHYNVHTPTEADHGLIDHEDSVWVLPEAMNHGFYEQPCKAKRMIWYLATASGNPRALPYKGTGFCPHLYLAQSYFGYKELRQSLGMDAQILKLTDFTRQSLLIPESDLRKEQRIAQVVFNPNKGLRHSQTLKKLMPDVRFVPIQGMNTEQLIDLGLKSKVYIDFGHHPGKDRLPREMAALGCVVISGNEGVASSEMDLPIRNLKMSMTEDGNYDYPMIVGLIRRVFLKYQLFAEDLYPYRELIRQEKDVFYSEVKQLVEALQ